MLLQIIQHLVERAIGSIRYAAVAEISGERSFGKNNIGNKRGTHIGQSVTYINTLSALDRAQVLRLAMSAAEAGRVSKGEASFKSAGRKDELIREHWHGG